MGVRPKSTTDGGRPTAAAKTNRIEVVIKQSDNQIKREFSRTLTTTTFWDSLFRLCTDRTRTRQRNELIKAYPVFDVLFPNGDAMKPDDVERTLFTPQDVPWYLDIVGDSLLVFDNLSFLHVRACLKYCDGYVYFALIGIPTDDKTPQTLLCKPFFHPSSLKTRPPDTKSEKTFPRRGLLDTLLFLSGKLPASPKESDLDWYEISFDGITRQQHGRGKSTLSLSASTTLYNGTKSFDLDKTKVYLYGTTKPILVSGHDFSRAVSSLAEVWHDKSVKSIRVLYNGKDSSERKRTKRVLYPSKSLLMVSRNFREGAQRLAEAWHDKSARSILICGGSGSGKEELKDLLAYAATLGNGNRRQIVEFSAPEMNNRPERCFVEQIFDEMQSRKLLDGSATSLFRGGAVPVRSLGKSKRKLVHDTLLVFDEVHHPGLETFRDVLLRFLESQTLQADDSEVDCKDRLLCVFMASVPLSQIRELRPFDLWTRLEYAVELAHPLSLSSRRDRNESLTEYFRLFWERCGIKHRDTKGTIPACVGQLKGDEVQRKLAQTFSDVLDSPLIPLISIRTIRTMVNRLHSKALYHMRVHLGANEIRKASDVADALSKEFDEWIVQICKEVAPTMNPKELF